MTDTMTPEQRHRCMSHIRSKATKPELLVRRWLWSHGYRYRLNVKSVPGCPDIVMRPYRTAIFVNGCFWHGHNVRMREPWSATLWSQCGNTLMRECVENSKCCKIPSSNREFWVAKIMRNQERDERNYRLLQENGWQVIVVWECQLKPARRLDITMQQVALLLENNLLAIHKTRTPVLRYPPADDSPLPYAAESQP